ncbi:MAG: S41 family peptidase [Alphaproteobacteria bacterium]|nr:S41 family peptidase [Alphaproteobacteria bacterium]
MLSFLKRVTYALLLVGIGIGISITSNTFANGRDDRYTSIALLGEILEDIKQNYVREIDDDVLLDAAIEGMVGVLDKHSQYYSPEEFARLQQQSRGEFGGIGIRVTRDDERKAIAVNSVIENTPSSRAGLQDDDLIIAIEGTSTRNMTLAEAVRRMRGKVGTKLTITIRRGDERFDVTLSRAIIDLNPVNERIVDNTIIYMHLSGFNEHSTESLEKAYAKLVAELDSNGLAPTAMILDLRNNPGGLLSQAVSVSDLFLNRGEIVSTRGREDNNARRFNASPGTLNGKLPLVLLINENSASASEIVAGALKDHRKATIVGITSYGKGSVQTTFPIGDAEVTGALKLTIQNYYTPDGNSIDETGVAPDVEVMLAEQVEGEPFNDNQLDAAVDFIRGR